MIDNGTPHWTDDDDLVSRFVLRQLPQSEETRLSEHLATCERCRQAVNQETLFAARMKRAGRDVMKQKLRLLVSEPGAAATGRGSALRGHVPWVRIAGVAAVVVIIIAVGVYNNWLGREYRTSSPITEPMTQEQPATQHDTARSHQDTKEAGKENLPGTSIAQSTKPPDKTYRKQAAQASTPVRPEVAGKKETAGEGQPEFVPSEQQPKPEEKEAIRMLQKDEQGQVSNQAMSISTQRYWVEGRVLSTRKDARQSLLKSFSSSLPERDRRSKEKLDLQGAVTRSSANVISPLSLQQQPLSSLPLTLRTPSIRHGTIPALIESSDRGIQLTLFLDFPVPDSVLRSAVVRIIDNDSLLVVLPHQLIGLTLPPGISSKVNSNAKEVK